jgi:pimeloyl-ACP methyl ester carboxylesterase
VTQFRHELIRKLDASAEVIRTPYGGAEGHVVWRRWGSGPDLVLLHGGAGSWLHWIRNIEKASAHRTVWVPDMPGFGESTPLEMPSDADSLAPMIRRGLDELLAGRDYDLVGFSFGGLTAGLIAAEVPPRLRRLALVSSAAMGLMNREIAYRSVRGLTDPAERLAAVRHNINALMLHAAASIDDLAIEVHEYGASHQSRRTRHLVRSDIMFELSGRWKCDAWGLWSEQDPLYAHQVDRLREAVAGLGLREGRIVSGTGHWLQYETPDKFDGFLADALAVPVSGGQPRSER